MIAVSVSLLFTVCAPQGVGELRKLLEAEKVMDRLLSYGTPGTEGLLRIMVAEALLGIVHQALLPTVDGGKRVACETLVATPAVRGILRARTDHQLRNVIQSGRNAGMQTMSQSLSELFEAELISEAIYEDVLKSYE